MGQGVAACSWRAFRGQAYGFKRNALTVRVRQALLFYAIRRWGLDRTDSRLTILEQRVIQTGRNK